MVALEHTALLGRGVDDQESSSDDKDDDEDVEDKKKKESGSCSKRIGTIPQAVVILTTVITRVTTQKHPKSMMWREERLRTERQSYIMNKNRQRTQRNIWK